jgi:hypothetical protein
MNSTTNILTIGSYLLLELIIATLLFIVLGGFLTVKKNFKSLKDAKEKKPKSKPNPELCYQIKLPSPELSSLEEMQMFFTSISSIKKQNNKHQFTFEIHSDAGMIDFYLICKEDISVLLTSTLENRFPGIQFDLVQDPYSKICLPDLDPDNLKLYELGSSKVIIEKKSYSDDLLPTLNWRNLQSNLSAQHQTNSITNDPINHLINALSQLRQGEYAVFQLILKPASIPIDKYKKQFEQIRKELATNATVDGANALTIEEKNILNEISKKVYSESYHSKIRFAYVSGSKDLVSKINWENVVITFLQQFKTAYQQFEIKNPYSYQDYGIKYLKEVKKLKKLPEAKKIDEIYKKQVNEGSDLEYQFRQKQAYISLVSRSIDSMSLPLYIDTDSLTCLFHFPNKNSSSLPQITNQYPRELPNSAHFVELPKYQIPNNLPF